MADAAESNGPSTPQESLSPLQEQTNYLYGAVRAHILPLRDWYALHIWWPRVLFRSAGSLVILGSLSLPIIASHNFEGRDWLLGVVSVLVAALTSLNAFFHWDSTWRSYAQTERQLESAIAKWDLQMQIFQAGKLSWPEAVVATQELFEQVHKTVSSETDQFFSTVKFPDVGPGREK
jgi:hypothetical protein